MPTSGWCSSPFACSISGRRRRSSAPTRCPRPSACATWCASTSSASSGCSRQPLPAAAVAHLLLDPGRAVQEFFKAQAQNEYFRTRFDGPDELMLFVTGEAVEGPREAMLVRLRPWRTSSPTCTATTRRPFEVHRHAHAGRDPALGAVQVRRDAAAEVALRRAPGSRFRAAPWRRPWRRACAPAPRARAPGVPRRTFSTGPGLAPCARRPAD